MTAEQEIELAQAEADAAEAEALAAEAEADALRDRRANPPSSITMGSSVDDSPPGPSAEIAQAALEVGDVPFRNFEDVRAIAKGEGDPTGEEPGGRRLFERGVAGILGAADMATLGHGDEVQAGFQTAKDMLTKQPSPDEAAAGITPTMFKRYYANRDASEAQRAERAASEPGAVTAGQAVALGLPLAGAAGAGRAVLASKGALPRALALGRGAATDAALGAGYAAGASEAKPMLGGEELAKYGTDVGAGAVVNAATGLGLRGAGALMGAAAKPTQIAANKQAIRAVGASARDVAEMTPEVVERTAKSYLDLQPTGPKTSERVVAPFRTFKKMNEVAKNQANIRGKSIGAALEEADAAAQFDLKTPVDRMRKEVLDAAVPAARGRMGPLAQLIDDMESPLRAFPRDVPPKPPKGYPKKFQVPEGEVEGPENLRMRQAKSVELSQPTAPMDAAMKRIEEIDAQTAKLYGQVQAPGAKLDADALGAAAAEIKVLQAEKTKLLMAPHPVRPAGEVVGPERLVQKTTTLGEYVPPAKSPKPFTVEEGPVQGPVSRPPADPKSKQTYVPPTFKAHNETLDAFRDIADSTAKKGDPSFLVKGARKARDIGTEELKGQLEKALGAVKGAKFTADRNAYGAMKDAGRWSKEAQIADPTKAGSWKDPLLGGLGGLGGTAMLTHADPWKTAIGGAAAGLATMAAKKHGNTVMATGLNTLATMLRNGSVVVGPGGSLVAAATDKSGKNRSEAASRVADLLRSINE